MAPAFDWESVQQMSALIDDLPGHLAPYALTSGGGLHTDLGDWHATTMARHCDTAGEFSLQRIDLPGGSASPFMTVPGHTFIHVLEGELTIRFETGTQRLIGGDSASIPERTPFALAAGAALNSFYLYTTDDWLQRLAERAGTPTASHVFTRRPARTFSALLAAELADAAGVHLVEADADGRPPPPRAGLPGGAEPFATKAGGGDRYETYQQINAYPVRARNTGGRFFAMDTRGAKAPYIPLHFHREHSENFLCLAGRVGLYANGTEIVLGPGDFLHAPAGTIHSFSLRGNNTHMLGLLTPPVFEPFFEYMNTPTEAIVHEEGGQPHFPAEGFARAQAELDLVVVGPPPHTA